MLDPGLSGDSLQPFVTFGPSHLIMLAATFLLPLALSLWARLSVKAWPERVIRAGLAAAMIGSWLVWYIASWRHGWLDLGNYLPLALCDWAVVAGAVALATRGQRAFELAYFWGMGGTVQAVFTPDTPFDFPEIRFILFWVFHSGIIASALFLVFGMKMRPHWGSLRRVLIWSLGYAAIAGLIDWLLGVNYGFLRAKPAHVSLFDALPAWPAYLPVLIGLGLLSLLIYYLPFGLYDLWRKEKAGSSTRP